MATPAVLFLRFQLPDALKLCVGPGRWHPCQHQARVEVGEEGDVEIRAENWLRTEAKRILLEQAQRFLIEIAGGKEKLPTASFSARLFECARPQSYSHYEIVTGASVSITHAVEQPAIY